MPPLPDFVRLRVVYTVPGMDRVRVERDRVYREAAGSRLEMDVYRPGDAVPWAEVVERRSMAQHVERLVAAGRVREVEPGRFVARGA